MSQSRFTVVPAAYVFLLRAGADGRTEVLLQRRGDVPFMAGHWAAGAAGHVEEGETVTDAALREAREELGLTGVDLEFLTTMQRRHSALPIDQRVDFFFTARSWSGEPRIMEQGKASDLDWFALDALPQPLVPHEAYALGFLAAGAGDVPALVTFGF